MPALLVGALIVSTGCEETADSASAAGAGAGGAKQQDPIEVVEVAVGSSIVAPLPRLVEVVGTLHGDEQTTVSAKVPGRVARIFADVGDRLPDGAPLALIDPTDYELAVNQDQMALNESLARVGLKQMPGEDFDIATVATVERAAAQAANAKARLDRVSKLLNQTPPLISEQDYADTKTAYEVAQRDYEVAVLEARSQLALARVRLSQLNASKQRLTDTQVNTPQLVEGSASRPRHAVTVRRVAVGEYVREGDPLFDLVADDPIKFRTSVPEKFVKDVQPGQPVQVAVAGYEQPFVGKVSRVNPAVDPQNRSFEVEVLFDNEDGRLRPGAFARGHIEVGQETATLVPADSLVVFAGVEKVYTIDNGKAVEHRVVSGVHRDGYIEIREGLKGEMQVITTGHSRLASDVPVKVETATAQKKSREPLGTGE